MKCKLDESFGSRCANLLRDAGVDVATVASQALEGSTDRRLFDICKQEHRCLITLDLDFSNPMRFSPAGTAGIAVVRIPGTITLTKLTAAVEMLVRTLSTRPIAGKLWIVETRRVREYQSAD